MFTAYYRVHICVILIILWLYRAHICMMPITYIFTATDPNTREGELGTTNRMQHYAVSIDCSN